MSALKNQKRGGKGSIVMKFKELKSYTKGGEQTSKSVVSGSVASSADGVRCMRICNLEDEVVVSSLKGVVTRVKVNAISVQGKRATGVKLQGLQPDDRVTMLDVIQPESSISEEGKFPSQAVEKRKK